MDLTWLTIIETHLKVIVAFVAGLWAFFLLFYLRSRAAQQPFGARETGLDRYERHQGPGPRGERHDPRSA